MKKVLTWVGAILAVLAIYGWIANIVKLFSTSVVGEAILRAFGIVVAPLGAVLGFL